jgi:serine/threonine-protein phosphatase 2B catalytic subunit
MFPVPSMRIATRRSTDGLGMEELIKRTFEEGEAEEGSAVELLAERIARGRSTTSRPSGLKRHGTA